mmetsp:Transcript_17239/g.46052  ORF Transcript_17239/g.46052 Transcript_17239/m.46052 type:complete len:154 (-) Transcript_17239:111-572(-)
MMGGVDMSDQLRSYYQIVRRSRKWWKRVLFMYWDISLVNAPIIFKQNQPAGEKKSRLLQFKPDFVKVALKKAALARGFDDGPGRKEHRHMPGKTQWVNGRSQRLPCRYCFGNSKHQVQVTTRCMECDVPLHIDSTDGQTGTCFTLYHKGPVSF